jgi:hypothetical protein
MVAGGPRSSPIRNEWVRAHESGMPAIGAEHHAYFCGQEDRNPVFLAQEDRAGLAIEERVRKAEHEH